MSITNGSLISSSNLFNSLFRLIADKVAAIGFYVVVPDFFYGDPYVPEIPLSSWFRNHLPAKGRRLQKAVADLISKGASVVGVAGMTVFKLSSFVEIEAAVILHPVAMPKKCIRSSDMFVLKENDPVVQGSVDSFVVGPVRCLLYNLEGEFPVELIRLLSALSEGALAAETVEGVHALANSYPCRIYIIYR
ncbi:putative alpha/beta hydrolase fold protein [Tanacetum coccineum]